MRSRDTEMCGYGLKGNEKMREKKLNGSIAQILGGYGLMELVNLYGELKWTRPKYAKQN